MAAFLTALLLLLFSPAAAQPSPAKPTTASGDNPYNSSVSPALAILVVAIVCAFLLLGFFSIYLRRCSNDNSAVAPATIAGIIGRRSRSNRGLDPSLLEKFPTMVYSTIKGKKLGKESLECAVCLCEFEDDDVLRLLPGCSHVYHRDCVDVWFAGHVTCPVCRSDVGKGDIEDLVRIGSQRREARSGSGSGSVKRGLNSAGDWVAAVAGGAGERFRLRLPEEVRREIMEAGTLRRSASFAVFTWRGEGSSRRGFRRSGRWPVFGRSFSERSPVTVVAVEGYAAGGVGEKTDDDAVLLGTSNLV